MVLQEGCKGLAGRVQGVCNGFARSSQGTCKGLQVQGWTAMAQKEQWARKDSFCIRNLYGIYTEKLCCRKSANAFCDASKDKPMIFNEKLLILDEKPRKPVMFKEKHMKHDDSE